jgi:uncharacterized protein YaiI (UPF0178 family)
MQIFVDADACPRKIKEIVYRAAQKAGMHLVMIANTHIRTPPIPFFRSVTVPKGIDLADDRIADLVNPGDLVITADIPLADRVVKKGGYALDPRGKVYSEETIGAHLAMRDLAQHLRESGVQTGGPAPFGPNDCQNFANKLQSILSRCGNV